MEHVDNIEAVDRDASTLNLLMAAAELAINDGLAYSYADDPHRVNGLHREFDKGRAHRRLVIDFMPHGKARVALELHGHQGGELRVVEVFGTTLQGKVEPFETKFN